MKRLERGFTLIELLVVIAIIGILSSIVLASLNTARAKGADAATKSNLDSARAQAELYYDSNGQSYLNVCSSTTGANGVRGVITNLVAAAQSGGFTATPVTLASTAGNWQTTTCHDSQNAWAAEAPLKASVSGTPDMWCIDNTGKSVEEKTGTTNLAASSYTCQ